MTVEEFYTYLNTHTLAVLFLFFSIPVIALVINWICSGEGEQSPWKYIYAMLIYAACIPGILSVALGIYLFLFEPGSSIYRLNLLTHVLPVVAMIATLAIIRRNVALDYVPGFGRISTFIFMILAIFILMYIMQRLHLIMWIYMPAQYFLLTVVGLLLILHFSLKRLIA